MWDVVVGLTTTSTQGSNPCSIWYERLLNEILSHLERKPRDKGRRITWLMHIEPLLNGIGLVLLVHCRRMFRLFFHWMLAGDDDAVLLVRNYMAYAHLVLNSVDFYSTCVEHLLLCQT
ncbi:hypothetical protein LIER_32137 [Lithospermum erythrorhizon]|uniref:Uncharacterized protein n=1 Tax=Lithospermum erythrorhizon TaxID=34254 RepID=A0AAV3RWM1_LITER